MYLEVQTFVFVPALILIVLCPRSESSTDSPSPSDDSLSSKSAPDLYINALETFDAANPSNTVHCCSKLTSAVQALLKDTDARRWDQLMAPLFAFANTRKDLFPDVQYRLNFYLPYMPRIDVLFQRKDGTVFVFTWNLPRVCKALRTIQREHEGQIFYRPVRKAVTHTVIGAFFFDKVETGRFGALKGVNARFLVDTFDEKKEISINVTAQRDGKRWS
ncbi:unnamed protein product [Bemisia tabaci]|uniref:Uncharacterized protein n=1 Tax=Bemisia tabaci TaxID=7038 RepID=A0A9P0C9E0_BEMTA|nr:unnamed protein product [Bemisia tabaci]